jgi:hypothetical protein
MAEELTRLVRIAYLFFDGQMGGNVTLKKSLLGAYFLHYSCPKCGGQLSSPVDDAGANDTCPDCNGSFIVPGADLKAKVAADRESKRKRDELLEDDRKKKAKERDEAALRKQAERQALTAKREAKAVVPPTPISLAPQLQSPPVLSDSVQKCPFCAEIIQVAALKCKHCGEFLDWRGAVRVQHQVVHVEGKSGCNQIIIIALGIFFGIVLLMFL